MLHRRIATLLALAFLALPAAALGSFPGANGRLAYTDGTGHEEVATINPDGSGFALLTSNPGSFNVEPAWSPDGRRIAFVSNRGSGQLELWTMNADGSNPVNLPTPPLTSAHDPAWSPDGTKIAFTGNEDIYVVNVDGTGLTQLTNSAGSERGAAWSPDGTKIAYGDNTSGRFDVFVMNPEGGGKTNLTRTSSIHDEAPSWAPDGSRIAYFRGNLTDVEVFSMKPDGSDVVQLSDGTPSFYPAWSPDGTKIAFGSTRDAGGNEIYVMNTDGSGETRVTFNGGFRQDFDWQPVVNRPPGCSGVEAAPGRLFPPDRRLHVVELSGATDPDGDGVTIEITGVTQDEPTGSSPDAVRPQGELVRLRSERDPRGDGRVYRIAFTASDGRGGECDGVAKVGVPRHRHRPAVDSAPPSYDSLAR